MARYSDEYTRADAAADARADEMKRMFPDGYRCAKCGEEDPGFNVEVHEFDYEYHGMSGTHCLGEEWETYCCGTPIISNSHFCKDCDKIDPEARGDDLEDDDKENFGVCSCYIKEEIKRFHPDWEGEAPVLSHHWEVLPEPKTHCPCMVLDVPKAVEPYLQIMLWLDYFDPSKTETNGENKKYTFQANIREGHFVTILETDDIKLAENFATTLE